jgi:hypothetical protein
VLSHTAEAGREGQSHVYYVPRLGGTWDAGRPQTPLTDEQCRLWEENRGWGQRWGGLSGLPFLAALACALLVERSFRAGARGGKPSAPTMFS